MGSFFFTILHIFFGEPKQEKSNQRCWDGLLVALTPSTECLLLIAPNILGSGHLRPTHLAIQLPRSVVGHIYLLPLFPIQWISREEVSPVLPFHWQHLQGLGLIPAFDSLVLTVSCAVAGGVDALPSFGL